MVATGSAPGLEAPGSDCAGHYAHRAHGIGRSPLEILAGDVFERLPARPEVDAIADFGIASDGRHFRIEEMGHEAGDRVGSNDGIGVDADEQFGVADVLPSKVERLGLAP